jgi:hypothetical protein
MNHKPLQIKAYLSILGILFRALTYPSNLPILTLSQLLQFPLFLPTLICPLIIDPLLHSLSPPTLLYPHVLFPLPLLFPSTFLSSFLPTPLSQRPTTILDTPCHNLPSPPCSNTQPTRTVALPLSHPQRPIDALYPPHNLPVSHTFLIPSTVYMPLLLPPQRPIMFLFAYLNTQQNPPASGVKPPRRAGFNQSK